jgi:DNA-directed RNA polymerase subunit RPC12/RpoP
VATIPGWVHLSYRLQVSTVEESSFSAWSLLSLTSTAQGVLAYPDELGVRYVYDTAVPNSRYVAVGDLAVIRDNRDVLGAGWIDSIEVTSGRKIRYRCPDCGSTDFKFRSKQRFTYRCSQCSTEFDNRDEEELTVQVFTANYSRTYRPADRPFPVKALDPAYVARSQQNAIRRLDAAVLRPVLDSHLTTGGPWWETHVREDERIPGGHGAGLSKTRVGQQRFREAMLARFGEACAFTGPQPPGALEAAHLYLYSKNPEHDLRGGLLLRCDLHALFDRWLIAIDPDTWSIQIAPELKRYPGLAELEGRAVQLPEDLRPRLKYVQEHAGLAWASWA